MNTTIETSTLNISIMELSKEDLQREFQTLKKTFLNTQKELELKYQQIYDLQRDLTRASALERDYQQEIEVLQSNEKDETKKLHAKIHLLEDDLNSTRVKYREQIQSLENEVTQKTTEITKHEEDMKFLTKTLSDANISSADYDKLLNEKCIIKEENDVLIDLSKELQSNLETTQKELNELKLGHKNLNMEFEKLNENYNCKKCELIETQSLMETMQEDLAIMRTELDSVKSKPLDSESRGNSLFAEVNDRRVELQKNMSLIKSQYLDMRQQYSGLLAQISKLQVENKILTKKWEEDVADKETDDERIERVYTKRIVILEEIIAKYEKQFADRQTSKEAYGNHSEFIQCLFDKKDDDIKTLMDSLNKESFLQTILSRDLQESNTNLRKWKSLSYKLECEISELKTEIENLKLNNPTACAECEDRKRKPYERKGVGIQYTSKQKNYLEKSAHQKQDTIVELDLKQLLSSSEPEKEIERKLSPVDSVFNDIIKKSPTKSNEKENVLQENKAERKGVTFHDDTIDHIGKGKMRRRPGRVISFPTVYVPSFPQKNDS